MQDVQYMISSFREHLQMVYEMETFYGDQTLMHLLQHANSAYEMLDQYQDIYTFVEFEEEYEDAEEQEEEEVAS